MLIGISDTIVEQRLGRRYSRRCTMVRYRENVTKLVDSSRQGTDTTVPDDLSDWVEKVARHAYRTTDEDIESLKAAGYSEDQIFELTVAAALGASRARLERALGTLAGKKGETQ